MAVRRLCILGVTLAAACSSFEAAPGSVDGGPDALDASGPDGSESLDAGDSLADALAPRFQCPPDAGLCEGFERSGRPHTGPPLSQVLGSWTNEYGPGVASPFAARFTSIDAGAQKLLGMSFQKDALTVSCTMAFVVDAVGKAEVDLLRFTSTSPIGPKVVLTPGSRNVSLRFDTRSDSQNLGVFVTGTWVRLRFGADATKTLITRGVLGTGTEQVAATDAGVLPFGSVALGLKGAVAASDWAIRIDDVTCYW